MFPAFAAVAKYKDLPKEDKNMFKASAYYTLNTAFAVLPHMSEEHMKSMPEGLLAAVEKYRDTWINFVGKWRTCLDCFDYSIYVKFKEKELNRPDGILDVTIVSDGEMASFLYNKAFEPRVAGTITVRKDIAEKIASGLHPKLSLGTLESVAELFLMLNFVLTISTVEATNDTPSINLIDQYNVILEKRKAKKQRAMLANDAICHIETVEAAESSDTSTEELDTHTAEDEHVFDDMPELIQGNINDETFFSDNDYIKIGEFIFILCSPVLAGSMERSGSGIREPEHNSSNMENTSNIVYPEWVDVKNLEYSIDVVMHLVVLFINEHSDAIFAEKIEMMRRDMEFAKKNNFNVNLSVSDYLSAMREMFSDHYRKKYGDLNQDRDDLMGIYGIRFINENKKVLLMIMRDLHTNLVTRRADGSSLH